MGDDVEDGRITAVYALLSAAAGVEARLGSVFARHDLSRVDFDVLVRLARDPHNALRMSQLTEESWLTTSGVTRVVDRLEQGGLVRREACVGDRRALMAVLTHDGSRRVEEVLPDLLPEIERWFTSTLDEAESASLVKQLGRIRDRARDE